MCINFKCDLCRNRRTGNFNLSFGTTNLTFLIFPCRHFRFPAYIYFFLPRSRAKLAKRSPRDSSSSSSSSPTSIILPPSLPSPLGNFYSPPRKTRKGNCTYVGRGAECGFLGIPSTTLVWQLDSANTQLTLGDIRQCQKNISHIFQSKTFAVKL